MNKIIIILLCCVLVSCQHGKNITYLQNAASNPTENTIANPGIKIQPKDQLSIVVSSKDPELASSFNLPLQTTHSGSGSFYSYRLMPHSVDENGEIDFPILGKLKVTGLTRHQLSEMIKQILILVGQIKDPVVTVEFMNFRITVLGEVRSPGTFDVPNDMITLLEAIGRAGDLTIYGKRENVLVRREQNGVIQYYYVDLRSTSISHSPAFYLQQNDVVYVEPNNTKAAQAYINENKRVGVWISVASLLTSVMVLIFK